MGVVEGEISPTDRGRDEHPHDEDGAEGRAARGPDPRTAGGHGIRPGDQRQRHAGGPSADTVLEHLAEVGKSGHQDRDEEER